MKLRSALLCLLAVAVPSADVAAKCARTELGPDVWTTPDAKIAADGGIVVGWDQSTDNDKPAAGDPSVQPTWTAVAGGKPVKLALTTLAPGLTVYRPATPVTGALQLRAAGGAPLVAVTLGAKVAPLDAPAVTHVRVVHEAGFRRMDEATVTASVNAVPDAAVALVVMQGKTALSFGRPAHDKQGPTTVVVYASPGHCGMQPPGMIDVAAGTKIRLAWVDASGRLSPESNAVAVEAGK